MLLDSYWQQAALLLSVSLNEAIIAFAMCSGRGMIKRGCMCQAVGLLSVCQELREQNLFNSGMSQTRCNRQPPRPLRTLHCSSSMC